MQIAREMAAENNHWELFAATWKAMGFDFDANLLKRTRAHGRMLAVFLEDVKSQLVPKGTRISAADLSVWTEKLERLQKVHGQLLPLFGRESDRFVREFGDAGAAWTPVGGSR